MTPTLISDTQSSSHTFSDISSGDSRQEGIVCRDCVPLLPNELQRVLDQIISHPSFFLYSDKYAVRELLSRWYMVFSRNIARRKFLSIRGDTNHHIAPLSFSTRDVNVGALLPFVSTVMFPDMSNQTEVWSTLTICENM